MTVKSLDNAITDSQRNLEEIRTYESKILKLTKLHKLIRQMQFVV